MTKRCCALPPHKRNLLQLAVQDLASAKQVFLRKRQRYKLRDKGPQTDSYKYISPRAAKATLELRAQIVRMQDSFVPPATETRNSASAIHRSCDESEEHSTNTGHRHQESQLCSVSSGEARITLC